MEAKRVYLEGYGWVSVIPSTENIGSWTATDGNGIGRIFRYRDWLSHAMGILKIERLLIEIKKEFPRADFVKKVGKDNVFYNNITKCGDFSCQKDATCAVVATIKQWSTNIGQDIIFSVCDEHKYGWGPDYPALYLRENIPIISINEDTIQ